MIYLKRQDVRIKANVMHIEWQVACAIVVVFGIIILGLIFGLRDFGQLIENQKSTQDRIGAAAFKNGADATIELVEKLVASLSKMECKYDADVSDGSDGSSCDSDDSGAVS